MSSSPSARDEVRALVALAAPIWLAHVLLMSIPLVDTSVLGHVSVEDLAGASIGRMIGFASICIGTGIAMALEPLASQALGAKEPARAWRAYTTTLRLVLLVWVPTVLASFAITLVLPPLGVEQTIVERSRAYILGQAPGMALTVAFLATKTFLQAHGVTTPAFVAAGIANVTNFVAVNLLVRGDDALAAVHLPSIGLPRLGAFGGGLASSLADLALVAFLWRYARDQRSIPTRADEEVSMRAVWRLGAPIGLQLLAEVGLFTAASMLSAHFGVKMAAANQVALALVHFTYMGALGISGATAVRVGMAVGEGRSVQRAGMIGIVLAGGVMMVPAVVFWTIPETLAGIFTGDPEVIALAARLLRIAAIFQLFDGVQGVASGALRGAGDVRFSFAANVVAHWFFGLPLALLLGFTLDLKAAGVWWGLTGGLMAIGTALFSRFVIISRRTLTRA